MKFYFYQYGGDAHFSLAVKTPLALVENSLVN